MQKQAGFSLIEIMIVIAITVILLSIAIPGFIGWLPAKRLQSAVGDIQGALNVARLGAVKENAAANIVFDTDAERYVVNVNGRTVRQGEMPPGVDLLSVTDLGTNSATNTVAFNSRGLVNPSIDIRVDGGSSSTRRRIRLNLSGSSKVFRD